MTPTETAPDTITLTKDQLKALVREMAAETRAGGLPPGAYRDEDGRAFHDVLEPTGRVRTNRATGKVEAINRTVQRPVHVVLDPSPDGLRQARRIAMAHDLDWYHPRLGWHLHGHKRQLDVEKNLGDGAALFELQYEEIPTEDSEGVTTATMQGVPRPPEEAPSAPPDSPPDVPEAAAPVAAAPRSRKEAYRGL